LGPEKLIIQPLSKRASQTPIGCGSNGKLST